MTSTADVICDTGVLSRAFVGQEPFASTIAQSIRVDNTFITPVIRIELYNWLSGYRQMERAKRTSTLASIKDLRMLHITEDISKFALSLADAHINSKPGDTLIAATTLHYNLRVYTLNRRDFQQLGVQLFE